MPWPCERTTPQGPTDMRLAITHQTQYTYAEVVESSHHLAHLTPLSLSNQEVLTHHLEIDPRPNDLRSRPDAFGNIVTHWALSEPHQHLKVISRADIQTTALQEANSSVSCAQACTELSYVALQRPSPAAPYACPSPHVPLHPELGNYARADFAAQRPLVQAALAFMRRMHAELTYDHLSTHIDTPAPEALRARRGVCQDFAHIMLGGLRHMGLAACYVSGYVLTQPAPGQLRVIGGDASHAWVALHVPGLEDHPSQGWLHLDPTNQRHGWGSPGEDYVILARGRDFADVSPLRGVLRGGDASAPVVDVSVQCLDSP